MSNCCLITAFKCIVTLHFYLCSFHPFHFLISKIDILVQYSTASTLLTLLLSGVNISYATIYT